MIYLIIPMFELCFLNIKYCLDDIVPIDNLAFYVLTLILLICLMMIKFLMTEESINLKIRGFEKLNFTIS